MKTKNRKTRKQVKASPRGEKQGPANTFRLSAEDEELLLERATEKGTNRHQTAKDLAAAALKKNDAGREVIEKIELIQRQIFELREEISLMAEVLLVNAGKRSREEASQWVDSNLKPK